MQVLDKGEVSLLNHMGGDLAVIAAARVSNGVDYRQASKGPEADQKLINYLVQHRHGTPFEHSTFQFYIKAPLFVRSEWHRHRMASYNEISGRYVEYEPEFYTPELWRVKSPSNKQGSQFPEYDESWENWLYEIRAQYRNAIDDAWVAYKALLNEGVAKEMARMVLPLSLYTQFYMTVNARGLMNFLSLRAADDAQWEIRQYAIAMKDMFKQVMPMTYSAWEQNKFIAP